MATIKFLGRQVSLDLKPGTLYRLAQSGFSLVDDLQDPRRQVLVAIEILRICSKTKLTSEKVADKLESYEPLVVALQELLAEEDSNQPKKGTPTGNAS